jgi:hypothetical protein
MIVSLLFRVWTPLPRNYRPCFLHCLIQVEIVLWVDNPMPLIQSVSKLCRLVCLWLKSWHPMDETRLRFRRQRIQKYPLWMSGKHPFNRLAVARTACKTVLDKSRMTPS